MEPPLFIQTVFGILGGIGPHPEDVMHMKRTADRLFGDQYRWSVLGAGRSQMPIAAQAAAMGGNVRVGLEDSLWIGPGRLAESNAQQVHPGAPDHRGARPRGRDQRRGARDPGPERGRPGRVLTAVRLGLIGSGFMGRTHALAYRGVGAVFGPAFAVDLALVADVSAERAAEAARNSASPAPQATGVPSSRTR